MLILLNESATPGIGLRKLKCLDFSMEMEKSGICAVKAAQSGIHSFAAGTVLKVKEMLNKESFRVTFRFLTLSPFLIKLSQLPATTYSKAG